MAEPIEETLDPPTPPSHREYLANSVDTMEKATDILRLERGTLIQGLWKTGQSLGQTEDEAEAYELDKQMEFLLTMTAQYTICLRVLETIGGAALQALAQTGIVVPQGPTLVGADGSELGRSRKPRKKRG